MASASMDDDDELSPLQRLPVDVAADLLQRLDRRARLSLRVTCKFWCARVDASVARLRTLPGPVMSLRPYSARAARWPAARELHFLRMRAPGFAYVEDEYLAEAADMVEAFAEHTALEAVELQMPPGESLMFARAIAARAPAGARRLARLTARVDPAACRGLLGGDGAPAPLAALAALTALELNGRPRDLHTLRAAAPPANAPHPPELPPSLRRLKLAGPDYEAGRDFPFYEEGCVGRDWLEALPRCAPGLEELEFAGIAAADAALDDRADPAALPAALMALTALTSVRGIVESALDWRLPEVEGSALFERLPHLKHVALYGRMACDRDGDAGELWPLVTCDWAAVAAAPCAPRLESLAFSLWSTSPPPSPCSSARAAAGGLVKLPALRALHVSAVACGFNAGWPADFAAFPALEVAIFGDSASEAPAALPPLSRVACLPRLQRLAFVAGEWGAVGGCNWRRGAYGNDGHAGGGGDGDAGSNLPSPDAAGEGRRRRHIPIWSALRAAPALREVELYDFAVPIVPDNGGEDSVFGPLDPLPWGALVDAAAAVAGAAARQRQRLVGGDGDEDGSGGASGTADAADAGDPSPLQAACLRFAHRRVYAVNEIPEPSDLERAGTGRALSEGGGVEGGGDSGESAEPAPLLRVSVEPDSRLAPCLYQGRWCWPPPVSARL